MGIAVSRCFIFVYSGYIFFEYIVYISLFIEEKWYQCFDGGINFLISIFYKEVVILFMRKKIRVVYKENFRGKVMRGFCFCNFIYQQYVIRLVFFLNLWDIEVEDGVFCKLQVL